MAAAVSTTPNLKTPSSQGRSCKNPTRRPLLPSETGNNVVAQRRRKATTREVTSRYMSTSSSSSSTSSSTASNSSYLSTRRSASPSATRGVLSGSAAPAVTPLPRSSLNKRSQSADRRRPATPRPINGGAEISTAAKLLMSSKRSLSISFQGESFLTPISKTKPSPQPNSVKATVEKRTPAALTPRIRGDHRENARPAERNPWPSSSRQTNLYNAWKATSDLRLSVSNRRLELSRMSLKLKLLSILKEQMIYLEEWDIMEKDHSNSLLGTTESLRASTVRLPIVSGAMADTQNLKDTMCAAYDVLQAMASSICSLMSKVEQMNSLLDEVVSTATSEHVMLDGCRDVLSALAAFQVKDCSLRAHNLQLKQVATSLPIET